MRHIQHEEGRWLVVWTGDSPILLEGTEGRQTSTNHEFDWYDTRELAVAAIHNLYPEWQDPNVDDIDPDRPVN